MISHLGLQLSVSDGIALSHLLKAEKKIVLGFCGDGGASEGDFHEATITGGIGGEISAFIAENLFEYLDGPVLREGSLDTPVPFVNNLEENFLPPDRFKKKLLQSIEY